MSKELLKRAKDTILKALSYHHEGFGHKIGAIDALDEINKELVKPLPKEEIKNE